MSGRKKGDGGSSGEGPLWKRITDELAARITGGKYRKGDGFHTQRELCERYKVSTITSVRVLDELAARGLIAKTQGKSCVVRRTVVDRDVLLVCRLVPPGGSGMSPATIASELVQGMGIGLAESGCRLRPVALDALVGTPPDPSTLLLTIYGAHVPEQLLSLLGAWGCRCVCCHAPHAVAGLSTVREDHATGVELGMAHLIGQGHRRIGYITTKVTSEWYVTRFAGYHKALQDHGLAMDLELVKELPDRARAGDETALRELLALPDPPTAVFISNQERALHIVEYCKQNKVRIPRDLAVVSFDNAYETSLCDPPLTVVDGHWREEGEAAARLLLDLAEQENPDPQDILITPDLVVRASSGAGRRS